ncbi:glycosyltransferase family 2 protein [Mycoplasma todarodis]|uniref:glycosyltransferase family 2 protein n=1 Tax=Mycoplasma todarodis TaxID=1937191 RepID=UPI003B2B5F01
MISVIVPMYNVSNFVEECLQSLVNQTLNKQEFEVIIVNDCSTDNSRELALKFIKENENFRLIDNEVNVGLSQARNIGLKNMNKESTQFFFIDSDDYVSENYLEKLSSGDGKLHFATLVKKIGNNYRNVEMNKWLFLESNTPIRSSVFLTPWYDRNSFFSEDIRYYEDFYFAIKNSYKMKSELHDDVFYYYRINPDSITQSGMNDNKLNDFLSETLKTYKLSLTFDKVDSEDIQRWISDLWIEQLISLKGFRKKIKNFFKSNRIKISSRGLSFKRKIMFFFIKIKCESLLFSLIVFLAKITKKFR